MAGRRFTRPPKITKACTATTSASRSRTFARARASFTKWSETSPVNSPRRNQTDKIGPLMPKDAHEMSENEIRSRILTLAFGGDERLFIAFYRKLQQGLPAGTG